MGRITDVPTGVTGAGQAFDYEGPPRSATVVLVNAPLDPDHTNVGLNRAAYDAFIQGEIDEGRAAVFDDVNLQDPEHDLILPIPYETAAEFYNYGRVTIGGRNWYVFYTAFYQNKTSTRFAADVDEWPSYTWELGYSQIERGHVAVAASAAGNIGYCLEPEPFTPGDLIGYAGYNYDPLGNAAVLVVSTVDLRANPFVAVDDDVVDTATDNITDTFQSGSIEAPFTPGSSQDFAYAVGSSDYDDLFFYPYASSAGLHGGNQMYRPFVTGATPSIIDSVAAEGGAFVYASVGAFITHMSLLAHTPWMVGGISRAVLIPGGSGVGNGAVPLTPWDHVQSTSGAPSYHSTLQTSVDSTVTLAADWTSGLPAAYDAWTKLRTGPFSAIELGDRNGAATDFDPQSITGLGDLTLRVQGAYYPDADVATWIDGAGGQAAPNSPVRVPLAVELPWYEVGRDAVYASGAAGIAAERAQSIFDMLVALQRAGVDNAFTLSSAYTATNYAVAEAV